MIVTPFNKSSYLRVATAIALLIVIGFKIGLPIVVHLKSPVKVAALASQTSENDGEKKAETNAYLEKEFINFTISEINHTRFHTNITHSTTYQNNYSSSYYLKITSPPPDFHLQSPA